MPRRAAAATAVVATPPPRRSESAPAERRGSDAEARWDAGLGQTAAAAAPAAEGGCCTACCFGTGPSRRLAAAAPGPRDAPRGRLESAGAEGVGGHVEDDGVGVADGGRAGPDARLEGLSTVRPEAAPPPTAEVRRREEVAEAEEQQKQEASRREAPVPPSAGEAPAAPLRGRVAVGVGVG